MKRFSFGFALVFTVVLCGRTVHAEERKKGTPLHGQIAVVNGEKIKVRTKNGMKEIVITDKTKFQRGDEAASSNELKAGVKIEVYASRQPTGELEANAINIQARDKSADSSENTADDAATR